MERLINAIIKIEGLANATAIMELLTTCSVTYIERRTNFGVKFRLTIKVNEVSYTIDGTIYNNGELFDSEYNFHNGEYEEYAGEGPIDFETLQACIEELMNF